MKFDSYSYGPVAAVYDGVAAVYSLGQIGRSKRYALDFIGPEDHVLFAGVGCGDEALEAAAAGCRVTAIDLSPEMLQRFSERLTRVNLDANLITGDVSEHRPDERYDVVVANYFLNLFEAERAAAMIEVIVGLLRPGGRLVVADFARPTEGVWARFVSAMYYRPVNAIAWMLRLCAWHPILDYSVLLSVPGLRVHSMCRFPVAAAMPARGPAFVSIVAERID